jgi:hypothetical protein
MLDRLPSEIVTVKLQEVEGAQHRRRIMPSAPQALEVGEPVAVTDDRFAIDEAGANGQGGDGGEDEREAVRPIVAVAS